MNKRVYHYSPSKDAYYYTNSTSKIMPPDDAIVVDTKEAEAEIVRRYLATKHGDKPYSGSDVYHFWDRDHIESQQRGTL
jgi:hypothetical protein